MHGGDGFAGLATCDYRDVSFRNEQVTQAYTSAHRNPFAPDLLADYDYMLIMGSVPFEGGLPPALRTWYEGAKVRIFRIEHAALE